MMATISFFTFSFIKGKDLSEKEKISQKNLPQIHTDNKDTSTLIANALPTANTTDLKSYSHTENVRQ